ncbi:hypothetical protein D3C79_571440 [compost metagenome]
MLLPLSSSARRSGRKSSTRNSYTCLRPPPRSSSSCQRPVGASLASCSWYWYRPLPSASQTNLRLTCSSGRRTSTLTGCALTGLPSWSRSRPLSNTVSPGRYRSRGPKMKNCSGLACGPVMSNSARSSAALLRRSRVVCTPWVAIRVSALGVIGSWAWPSLSVLAWARSLPLSSWISRFTPFIALPPSRAWANTSRRSR